VSFFGAIFTMVTMGLLFAALTIGGIFYMYSADLPSADSLANYAPPTISRIYSAEGAVMDEFATERRMFVPIGDIPDLVKNAFISAEDKHFYTHAGYDVEGMVAAARDAIISRGKNTRGASTITQQVMKNFLLSGDRSARESQLAIVLEGYEMFREFDRAELGLLEALRTMRLMHYAAWLARRWEDPAFPASFPWFNTQRYWQDHILELREQVGAMDEPPLVA
jgi:membrane carboxypeptidase/penicillin-binding protein